MIMKLGGQFWLFPPLVFFLAFYYLPLFMVFEIAMSSMFAWQKVLASSLFTRFFLFTIYQAIMTTIFAGVIGTVAGYALAHGKPYGKRILSPALTVPFLLPPISILVGFVLFFEPGGILTSLFGLKFEVFGNPWAIILAHTLYNISVFAKMTESAFKTEPGDLHLIGEMQGANFWRRLKTITLPYVYPTILAASLITFLYAFNSFAIVLLIGEVKYQTLEVMIYIRTRLRLDFMSGAVISIIQLLINMIVVVLYLRYSRKEGAETEGGEYYQPIATRSIRLASTAFILFILILTWFPIISTFIKFFQSYEHATTIQRKQLLSGTFDYLLGTSPLRVIMNTIGFAISTGIIGISIAVMIVLFLQSSHSELNQYLISFFTILPMATSGITISFAILLLFGSDRNFSSLVWIFILAAHLLAALPFVIRSVLTSYGYVPEEMLGVSEMLGADAVRTFRKIVYPFIKKSLTVAFLFASAISVGEFGATYYLSRGEWITVSTAIGKLFNSRYTMLPLFFASLLSLLALSLFMIIEGFGEFDLKV